jgi:hypothetical protein
MLSGAAPAAPHNMAALAAKANLLRLISPILWQMRRLSRVRHKASLMLDQKFCETSISCRTHLTAGVDDV